MLQLSSLEQRFGTSSSFVLKCADIPASFEKGQFIELLPHQNTKRFSVALAIADPNKRFFSYGTDSETFDKLNSLVRKSNSSNEVFFQVDENDKTTLSIISFSFQNLAIDKSGSEIQVGVSSVQEAEDCFTFKKYNDRYSVAIKFNDNDGLFLLGTKTGSPILLHVVETTRKEAGAISPEKNNENETIRYGEIATFESVSSNGDYEVCLLKNQYEFGQVDSVKAVSKSEEYAESFKIKNKFLEAWKNFSDFEESRLLDIIEKTGVTGIKDIEEFDGAYKATLVNPDEWQDLLKAVKEHGLEECLSVSYPSSKSLSGFSECPCKISKNGQNIDSRFVIFEINVNKIQKSRFDISSSRFIGASSILLKTMFDRRNEAFERISSGKTGIPNLALLFDGLSSNRQGHKYSFTDQAKKEVFGKYEPTIDQKRAIRIALETPDIAIIQGPPGTGKTKVISAISAAIPKPNGDELPDLYTAYQNVATKNLSDNQTELFDFPYSVFASNTAKVDPIDVVGQWAIERAEKVKKSHPEAAALSLGVEEMRAFNGLSQSYNKEKATIGNDISVLDNLQKRCPDYLGESLDIMMAHQELLLECKRYIPHGNNNSKIVISNLSILPENKTAFEDGGVTFVDDVINRTLACLSNDNNVNDKMLIEHLKKLQAIYHKKPIDFDFVYKEKLDAIDNVVVQNEDVVRPATNEKIQNLLDKIRNNVSTSQKDDEMTIIANYIIGLETSPESVYKGMKRFQDKVFATHQMADSKLYHLGDQNFRNVIVDEAARSNPADLLIPLTKATEKIILVGDQNQLPQFIDQSMYESIDSQVMSDESKSLIKKTMFEYLYESALKLEKSDGIPRVAKLTTQFRMPKVLGNFIGQEFYSEKDSNGCTIPGGGLDFGGDEQSHDHKLYGLASKAMVFMDINNAGKAKSENHSFWNLTEADKIAKMLQIFSRQPESKKLSYGVISFYKSQVNLIKNELVKLGFINYEQLGIMTSPDQEMKIKVNTVDSFQGEERDVIILSVVKGADNVINSNSLSFLNDRHRLNVALSRAKKCCIVAADPNLFEDEEIGALLQPLKDFYDMCCSGKDGCAHVK